MNLFTCGDRFLLATFICSFLMFSQGWAQDSGQQIYQNMCASCHGAELQGGSGSSLVDGEWKYGDTRSDLLNNIKEGIVEQGMPAFGSSLSDEEINSVIDFIREVESGEPVAADAVSDTLQTLDYDIRVETYADSLEIPWAIDFINERLSVITERPGRLRLVINGTLIDEPVSGTPEVLHEGQGGLLDVTADPDFTENGWIYLSYSHAITSEEGDTLAMTRVVRGRINNNRWIDQQVLFEAPHETYVSTRHHYGSRIVFDEEGYLYFSIGDRGQRPNAQNLSLPNGKVHRIHPDGSIPDDNPFVNHEGALPSIYTYGHRNPQGLAIHPETDRIWDAEHGPRGGDEVNLLRAGSNYGWPVITYGIHYDGRIMTRERAKEGLKQPAYYWRPSIAVSGIAFYDKEMFPLWKNRLLVGALAYEEVRLLNVKNDRVIHDQVILKDHGRVREAVTGPDGAIYVVLNDPGKVVRISKVKENIR
ncbi:PQQ-dependent sugar dehydrogenase [Halalkalibaculum sp. DA3122]|uniref:PQQ-dependent sugar dehydrogenase n=1 Tax=unclassified Halalkalibaculum TaxID=2964617 RepID=UPI003754CD97